MPPIPASPLTTSADVLRFYLRHSPPDHALWKAIEWQLFREYSYQAPTLDLGCGDGVFSKLVFDEPLTAGIDILPQRVRKAKAAQVHQLSITGDATTLPFENNAFATVFSGCAMEHVPPMPQMLSEIARVLQPGGQLITTVPSGYFSEYLFGSSVLRRLGFEGLAYRYGKLLQRLLTIFHMYHPARWEKLLDDAGLELVEARHFLPEPTTALFDKLLIIGNMLQPVRWLLRNTRVEQRLVDWLYARLLPHISREETTGGALLLVARKAETS